MANMPTVKEAAILSDLLTYEESACKKSRLYARTLTNNKLANEISAIADDHEKRFHSLFDLL